jgi:hypothetical protein
MNHPLSSATDIGRVISDDPDLTADSRRSSDVMRNWSTAPGAT